MRMNGKVALVTGDRSAFAYVGSWPIADLQGEAESEGLPPNNGLQVDAPRAARA
jgi:hypothetical protein